MSAAPKEPGRAPRRAPADPDDAIARRDALVTRHRPYVIKVAKSVADALPLHVELDDLIGWGLLGLIDAAARYDARRGVTFLSFAHHRIRGAMLDGLRRDFDHSSAVPLPSDESLDAEGDGACADAGYGPVGGDSRLRGRLRRASVQDRHVHLREIRERLNRAMEGLSPLERSVLEHHYLHGEPVQLLAFHVNVSKSWLSRVHTRALAKLRIRLLANSTRREAYL